MTFNKWTYKLNQNNFIWIFLFKSGPREAIDPTTIDSEGRGATKQTDPTGPIHNFPCDCYFYFVYNRSWVHLIIQKGDWWPLLIIGFCGFKWSTGVSNAYRNVSNTVSQYARTYWTSGPRSSPVTDNRASYRIFVNCESKKSMDTLKPTPKFSSKSVQP